MAFPDLYCPSCCCPNGKGCYQKWTATRYCCPRSLSGPTPGVKECHTPSEIHLDWQKVSSDSMSCTYEIWVPMGKCCDGSSICEGLANTATPADPPSDCCVSDCAFCEDGTPISVTAMLVMAACVGCFTVNGIDYKWDAGTDLNQTVTLLPYGDCGWVADIPVTLTAYGSSDGTCSGDILAVYDKVHLSLVRTAAGWETTISIGPFNLITNEIDDVPNCLDAFDIASTESNSCPDAPINNDATAHFEPNACPP